MVAQSKIDVEVELTAIHCGACGGTYAISETKRDWCYDNGAGWHCPYCQISWGYFKNSLRTENERLKKENTALEVKLNARAAALQLSEHRERAQKAANTKLKKRLRNGVCPCCSRSFQNVKQHIANKHPDFGKENTTS